MNVVKGTLFVALFASLAAVFVSCRSGGSGTPTVVRTPTESASPDTGTCLPGETRPPVLAACEELAEQFSESRSDVELISAEPKDWPDSCLGAPKDTEVCLQVVTPGFEVVLGLTSQDRQFVYHTDQGTNVRLAQIRLAEGRGPDVELPEPELVTRGMQPVAFAFTPDGRLFYNERTLGEIRTVASDAVNGASDLFAQIETFQGSECGLLGIAVDPDFATNHYVYVYATQPVAGRTDVGMPRIIRVKDVDGRGTDSHVLVDGLPLTNRDNCAHVAGNLHFGPDGFLYVSVGNFERPTSSADLSVPAGKLLRLNKADGSAAPGNPFANRAGADKRIFAYGLRNTFDFAFSPDTDEIYGGENGPGNCDEINVIDAGADYGVPGSLHPNDPIDSCLGLGGVDPIYALATSGKQPNEFGSNVAPAGLALLPGGTYAELGEGLLVCEYVPHELHFLGLGGSDQRSVTSDLVVNTECRFNVEIGPDGLIYYSNAEGIYRMPTETA